MAMRSTGVCVCRASAAASVIIEPVSSSRVTFSSRHTAANTSWLPAMLAVCEKAARLPASVRPALTASHGFPARRARPASAANRAGSFRPSM